MDRIREAWAKLTPARRKKLYRIASMIAAILVAKGVVEADDIMSWLQVVGYALGVIAPEVAVAHISDE